MKKPSILVIFVFITALFAGCAQKGPILVDFAYRAPQGAAEEAVKTVVGVSPFKDERGKSASVAGKRFNSLNNAANDLVVQGTVPDKVMTALKNALTARGIVVRDVPEWNLTEAGIPADGSDLLISGQIKTLWLEAASSLANTKVKAMVELRVAVAAVEQKKIIRVLNVSSTIERENVSFSTAFVQDVLSEALSAALNQVFNDEEIKNRLK
jgi:hypothetical protein